MKRIFLLILTLIFAFSVCGCEEEAETKPENEISSVFSRITFGKLDEDKYINNGDSEKIWTLKTAEQKDYKFDYKIKINDIQISMPSSLASDFRKGDWDSDILDTVVPEETPFTVHLPHKKTGEIIEINVLKKKGAGDTLIRDCNVLSVKVNSSENTDFTIFGDLNSNAKFSDIVEKIGNPSFIKPNENENYVIFMFEQRSNFKQSLSIKYDLKNEKILSVTYTYNQ